MPSETPRTFADRLSAFVRGGLLPLVAAGLGLGALAWLAGAPALAGGAWTAATALVLTVLLVDLAVEMRRGEFGLDLIAALAMAGALALGETLAGAIIALMFTGGEALEGLARQRARRAMTALLDRLPRQAARYADGRLEDVAIERLGPGDRLFIRRGEVIPVDGTVAGGPAVLDESALTGEALPVTRRDGAPVMSGVTNAGDAFDLLATGTAAQSTYAGIVRLVEAAQGSKAPMARLADRYALGFLALALALAGAAWLASGDPVRALAVLVVATPCPLILAVPVAIVSGLSRCARRGVLVKSGGALEQLAQAHVVVLDKTGTLTDGRARLVDCLAAPGTDPDEVLRLAAALDQGSAHVIARALVEAAQARGLPLETPAELREWPGAGVTGKIGGRDVAVGGWAFIGPRTAEDPFRRRAESWIARPGVVAAAVAREGHLAGVLLLADELRPDASQVLAELRADGVARIVLATGDRAERAGLIAGELGLDAIEAGLTPDAKARIVAAERAHGAVMMIGDGVNDAPALATADIGVAMGARGAAASSEAADVVLLVDELSRLAHARRIARRARAIARQSVYAGIGLSCAGMVLAALGYLSPVAGALVQEAIDLAVILNALRALADPPAAASSRS